MSNLEQRKYYKIFTGTNQAEGYDKIHLGYEADTTEIILKKDKATYFHMPFFAESQTLADSTLIADGAIPGPFPALADRIYKKLGNYGDASPWGTPSERHDGQWLCSWLYAVSSEPPQWMDRYYDPGRLAYKEALEGNANFTDYIKQDPVYYDVPTSLVLEAGVLYQYFHQGEQTALKNVQTFAGDNKDRLRLNIEDWSCACPDNPSPVDSSVYNNTVTIDKFKNEWVVSLFDPGYQDRSSLSFNNTDFINCYVTYDETFNLENEFTTSFWVNNTDWANATSTQLVGNLQKGGYGVFYNNLNYNPYFVIPENTYGHLFYFNQEGNLYIEKNNQLILGQPANFTFINVNSNAEIVGVDAIKKRGVKYNHIGDVITYTKDMSGGLLPLNGDILNFVLSGNDDSVFFTSLSTYVFDKDLLLKTTAPNLTGYSEQVSFDINGNLIKELSCLDLKFDSYNQKWTINNSGILQCQGIALTGLPSNVDGSNTNIAIDPENNLWALAGSNKVYKINTKYKTLIDTYDVGVFTTDVDAKNISFLNVYNRDLNTYTWYAIIYHNFEKTAYQVTLDGKIFKNTFLPPKLNILDPVTALQDKTALTFTGKGDFTGYERRRIFNKILYNNNPQIQFKVAVTYPNRSLPYSINTLSIPAQYLVNNIWHLITVTLKNNNLKIFVDNYLRDNLQIPGNGSFNYEFKNDTYIGCPVGKTQNLNIEIGSQKIIWNGYIDSVRVYDYAIEPKLIQYFVREKTVADDITWNIQTAALQYVEVVDKFFKHRMPGSKSVFFNIRLTGTNITDPNIRQRIENDIKLAVSQIKPAYSELLRVEWFD
jgi:hypothetical protein